MNRSPLIFVLPCLVFLSACREARPPQSSKAVIVSATELSDEGDPPLVADAPSASENPVLEDAEPVDPPAQAVSKVVLEEGMKWKDLAHQLGTTVDALNAVNGIKLAPDTDISQGSEIYVPDSKP
jgi:hypothetical protein